MWFFVVVVGMGLLVIVGPGDPRTSEDLLLAIETVDFEKLSKNDLPYVTVANSIVFKWVIITIAIGILFVAISPWGEIVPTGLAGIVAAFTTYVIFQPALFLSEISFPIALMYMAAVFPALLYGIPKLLITIIRKIKGERMLGSEDRDSFYSY